MINKIGFVLWAENESLEKYTTDRNEAVFIPTEDFEYLIAEFRSVYPFACARYGRIEDSFDEYGRNYFSNEIGRQIVERIGRMKNDDPVVETFLREVIQWLNRQLRFADYLVVYGNL